MSRSFDESGFWSKVAGAVKTAGREVIEKALWLYYAAQRPETPVWAKTAIYTALGYFILPFDLIPDFLPGGYVDDLGVLTTALGTVAMYIDEEVKRKASVKLREWFGG